MIKERIIKCFDNIGVFIDPEVNNFLINEYITDSLTYVSMIMELEDEFSIEIPDEYLNHTALTSYYDIENMIEELLRKKD